MHPCFHPVVAILSALFCILNHPLAVLFALFPPMSIKWFEFGQPSDLHSTGETCSTGCMPSCFYWSELWRLTRQHTSPGSIRLSLCAHLVIGGFKYSTALQNQAYWFVSRKMFSASITTELDLKQRGSAIQPRVGVDFFFWEINKTKYRPERLVVVFLAHAALHWNCRGS